jgi:tRNA threonylcarbamoyladenosine biosynthesis protein TsaB
MKFYMLVLALDTTTRQGSAAVTRDGVLLGTFAGDAAVTHGERLPGDLIRLLSAHALRVSHVDLFAVAAGPGSFTGLRIGIATQQGLAVANNRPLVGISALDAINAGIRSLSPQPLALSPVSEVATWMDAQRGQVFSALYSEDRALESASVEKPADVLARWAAAGAPQPQVFAGDGALVYKAIIAEIFPAAHIVPPPPLAPTIARLAEAHVRRYGAVDPGAVRPIYVRRSDAELARDRVKS